MPKWVLASTVFMGGTQQVAALKGRPVKVKNRVSDVPIYNPGATSSRTMNLLPGLLGVLVGPAPAQPDYIHIAIPKVVPKEPLTFATVTKGAFEVVSVNWPTFKSQFEIEIP